MRVIVFIAKGFEEVEALTVVDYLRRVNIKVDMVSITDDKLVLGSHQIKIITDKLLKDIEVHNYEAVIIPGGMPGSSNLKNNAQVVAIVKSMYKQNKLVAAICAGPIVLAEAGIITNKKITAYPGFETELAKSNYLKDNVVIDKNIITAKGPYFAVDFALAIVTYLKGTAQANNLKSDILYK